MTKTCSSRHRTLQTRKFGAHPKVGASNNGRIRAEFTFKTPAQSNLPQNGVATVILTRLRHIVVNRSSNGLTSSGAIFHELKLFNIATNHTVYGVLEPGGFCFYALSQPLLRRY